MKPYIYSILFCVITSISFAQTKKVLLKKSYKVDENTILNLDLDNSDVHIIASKDDKIHFNYEITFYNYSQRKIEDLLDESIIKTSKKRNEIFLNAKSSPYLGLDIKYKFIFDFKDFKNPVNNAYKDYMQNYFKTFRERENLYKTQDSLIREINFSIGSDLNNYVKKDIDNYPLKKPLKTDRKIDKRFIIEIPKYVKMKIKSFDSDIKCDYDIETDFKLESFKGFFKFKKINGKNNEITSSNAILETYEIRNATLQFRDMYKLNFGTISNSKLKLEKSKTQIGQIGKDVSINDTNSKLFIYNFNKNFTKFNLKGDYTELNLYKVKDTNYAMDVFGYNSVLKMDNNTTSFGDAKEKKRTKILQKKPKENVKPSGNIAIELKNGILNIN